MTLALNSQLPEYNDMPPSGLIGARVHPSGALVAFKDRQVYFSRPYLPHSWPEDWIVSLPDEQIFEAVQWVMHYAKLVPEGAAAAPVQLPHAVGVDGLPAVEAACAEAIAHGVHSADVVLNILARQRDPAPPANILTPAALTLRHAPIADCARYDNLRRTI